MEAKKILIIRFSSIGDIVLTSPIIRCLKKQLPNAQIHYLTKENYKNILSSNPYITKIHTLKHSIADTAKELKSENFDFVVDLHHNLRSLLVKTKLNIPSQTFNKLNVRKEAKKESEVIVIINKNEQVTVNVTNSTEDFYKVTTATGIEGYCMKQFINVK